MQNLITMVSALLSAAAMVRGRIYGTLEQIPVAPLKPMELFVAKVIPTVVVVPLFSTLALFGVVQGVFDTPIQGSLPLFYSVMAVYVFSVLSLGLLVAVFARNIAQAVMILFCSVLFYVAGYRISKVFLESTRRDRHRQREQRCKRQDNEGRMQTEWQGEIGHPGQDNQW